MGLAAYYHALAMVQGVGTEAGAASIVLATKHDRAAQLLLATSIAAGRRTSGRGGGQRAAVRGSLAEALSAASGDAGDLSTARDADVDQDDDDDDDGGGG
jgi:hypothetical protein